MKVYTPLTEQLVQALKVLPGVGEKSARRMALYLLERNRKGAERLAAQLTQTLAGVGQCRRCRILCEEDLCSICSDDSRDAEKLCVVETPGHLQALESTGEYNGLYYVLMGNLSPIDGIGPDELGLDQLSDRVRSEHITEVILATSPTVEGEATAHFITSALEGSSASVSRLAQGIPAGADLDHIDGSTLLHALQGRRTVKGSE